MHVRAEGIEFSYFAADDPVPPKPKHGFFGMLEAEVRELMAGTDTRLTLVHPKIPGWGPWALWLLWQDGRDLAVLDEKVRTGTYTDEDFVKAYFAMPQRRWHNFGCKKFTQTFVFSPDGYIGAGELEMAKEKAAKKTFLCPHCGKDWGGIVLKIVRLLPTPPEE